jgi:hypothetical protein
LGAEHPRGPSPSRRPRPATLSSPRSVWPVLKQAPSCREDKLQLVQMQCDDKAYKCFDDFGMQQNAYVQDQDVMLESRGDNTSITNSPTKCSTICLSRSAVQVVVVSSAGFPGEKNFGPAGNKGSREFRNCFIIILLFLFFKFIFSQKILKY